MAQWIFNLYQSLLVPLEVQLIHCSSTSSWSDQPADIAAQSHLEFYLFSLIMALWLWAGLKTIAVLKGKENHSNLYWIKLYYLSQHLAGVQYSWL